MNVKRFAFSICLSTLMTLIFALFLFFLPDLFNYPLSQQAVVDRMNEKHVVDFINLQGSRVYIVYENGEYLVHAFEVGMLTNRFRFLWSFNVNEVNDAYILGRWRHFHIYFDDSTIEYNVYRGNTVAMRQRIYPVVILSLLVFAVTSTFLVYRTIFKGVRCND